MTEQLPFDLGDERLFRTRAELEAGIEQILASPKDVGIVEQIVARPKVNQRTILTEARLEIGRGLLGDHWFGQGQTSAPQRRAYPDTELTLMNSRVIALIAGEPEHWPLAGDQFFVDLDLSDANLPAGTRLLIGDAEIEVTAEPHLGCSKFAKRYGRDAVGFVNSEQGKKLNLRGINARIIRSGKVRVNDRLERLD